MKRIVQVPSDDTEAAWELQVFAVSTVDGDRFRIQVSDPAGKNRLTYSMLESIGDAFDALRAYFEVEGQPQVAAVLIAAAEAELRQ